MPSTGLSPERHAEVDAVLEEMHQYLWLLVEEYDPGQQADICWSIYKAASVLVSLRHDLQLLQHGERPSSKREPNDEVGSRL
jgi:hypothetical protein